jgi:hypothetical protein
MMLGDVFRIALKSFSPWRIWRAVEKFSRHAEGPGGPATPG